MYSDVIVNMQDGADTETSMIDFDETWSFDKPSNFNNKANSQLPQTREIEVPTSTLDVETRTVDTEGHYESAPKLLYQSYWARGDADLTQIPCLKGSLHTHTHSRPHAGALEAKPKMAVSLQVVG